MKKQTTVLSCALVTVWLTGLVAASAHCEIPCGIYGDRMRVDQLEEHFQTVETSIQQIRKLGEDEEKNWNQLVRWINNKELHANKIQNIVYQYFMNQRITPVGKDEEGYDEYVEQITVLHRMLVRAMKAKQTTDLEHVKQLHKLLDRFEDAYFEPTEKGHGHHH